MIRVIAGFEIANALLGIGNIVWLLVNGAFFGIYFIFISLYCSLFLYAGVQLLRNFSIGFRLSLALQAFVIPFVVTSSGYVTPNSLIRLPISTYVYETTIGVDLLALVLFVSLLYIGCQSPKDYTDH